MKPATARRGARDHDDGHNTDATVTATWFHIGIYAPVRPNQSEMLTCFANDLRPMYFNNRGALTLTVECG